MSSEHVQVLFHGGNVITMEDPVTTASADIAVGNGRILYVGDADTAMALADSDTEVVDVKGKTMMPGLIDSHNHMVLFGQNLQLVDVNPLKAKNIEGLIKKLRERAEVTPPGDWVKAWGYDDTRMEDGRQVTREDLDEACPNHPVSLMRTCMHVMAVNSLALEKAGIRKDTPEPEGGEIGRDSSGEPNGLLCELGAMNLVNRLIPYAEAEECAYALKIASRVYAEQGLTTVTEAGAGWSGNPNEAAAFQIAWQNRELIPRVTLGLMEDTYSLLPDNGGTGLFSGFGDAFLKIGPAKFVADGGIGARTAALIEPYENSTDVGVMCETAEDLCKRMERAHDAGFQISVHAIGDRTIDMVLSAYEQILSKYPKPHRHRIEHVAVCRPEFFERIRKLGLITVVQPAFLHYLGDSFIQNLGERRIRYTIPIRTMLEKGLVVAGSSDRPVTEGSPWTGIWAAVNRRTVSGKDIAEKERISVVDALKLYTTNGAFVNFEEDRVGSLTRGKFADIIVLEENPLEIPPDRLKDIQVHMTWVGGQNVWNKGNNQP